MGEIPSDNDRDLIHAILSGDPNGPRCFVEQYQTMVFGLCMRMMCHRQDAEDVAQETFVRALNSLSTFDRERPLPPWLLGIAANRCRTSLGKRQRRPVLGDPDSEPIDPRAGLHDPDDLAGELERALNRLRPVYRLVFTLFHEQGLAYDEIGQILGRPLGTIKTWLHRARSDLADDLSRRGVSCE